MFCSCLLPPRHSQFQSMRSSCYASCCSLDAIAKKRTHSHLHRNGLKRKIQWLFCEREPEARIRFWIVAYVARQRQHVQCPCAWFMFAKLKRNENCLFLQHFFFVFFTFLLSLFLSQIEERLLYRCCVCVRPRQFYWNEEKKCIFLCSQPSAANFIL